MPKPRDISSAGAKRLDVGVVSPELVLVDPELARAERARLEERARLAAYKASLSPGAPRHEDEGRIAVAAAAGDDERKDVRRGRARRPRPATALVVLLFAALAAGGAAAAWSLAGDHGGGASPPQAFPIATPPAGPHKAKATAVRTGSPSVVWSTPSGSHSTSHAGRTDRLPSAHLLERRLLALLAGAPTSKLPRQLVDVGRRSARTDLRAACRPSGARSFRCVIRSPRRPPNEGLHVRYRMRVGKGFFEWFGYRR